MGVGDPEIDYEGCLWGCGGYVLTGVTTSNGGDFNNMRKGYGDIFVIKLDKNGNLGVFMWFNKTIQKK